MTQDDLVGRAHQEREEELLLGVALDLPRQPTAKPVVDARTDRVAQERVLENRAGEDALVHSKHDERLERKAPRGHRIKDAHSRAAAGRLRKPRELLKERADRVVQHEPLERRKRLDGPLHARIRFEEPPGALKRPFGKPFPSWGRLRRLDEVPHHFPEEIDFRAREDKGAGPGTAARSMGPVFSHRRAEPAAPLVGPPSDPHQPRRLVPQFRIAALPLEKRRANEIHHVGAAELVEREEQPRGLDARLSRERPARARDEGDPVLAEDRLDGGSIRVERAGHDADGLVLHARIGKSEDLLGGGPDLVVRAGGGDLRDPGGGRGPRDLPGGRRHRPDHGLKKLARIGIPLRVDVRKEDGHRDAAVHFAEEIKLVLIEIVEAVVEDVAEGAYEGGCGSGVGGDADGVGALVELPPSELVVRTLVEGEEFGEFRGVLEAQVLERKLDEGVLGLDGGGLELVEGAEQGARRDGRAGEVTLGSKVAAEDGGDKAGGDEVVGEERKAGRRSLIVDRAGKGEEVVEARRGKPLGNGLQSEVFEMVAQPLRRGNDGKRSERVLAAQPGEGVGEGLFERGPERAGDEFHGCVFLTGRV